MLNLIAKTSTYITNQGDMWDMIALREYGDEHAMHYIQDANFYDRFAGAFDPDVTLDIPSPVIVQVNLKSRTKLPNLKELLPWR
jgi:hypothetical protein